MTANISCIPSILIRTFSRNRALYLKLLWPGRCHTVPVVLCQQCDSRWNNGEIVVFIKAVTHIKCLFFNPAYEKPYILAECVCVHLYLSFYLCCDRIRVGTGCFCQVPGKVFIFLLQETLSHLCRYHVSELYCLAHFHFLNFPLLYTIYVPIVYSSSHTSPTH